MTNEKCDKCLEKTEAQEMKTTLKFSNMQHGTSSMQRAVNKIFNINDIIHKIYNSFFLLHIMHETLSFPFLFFFDKPQKPDWSYSVIKTRAK